MALKVLYFPFFKRKYLIWQLLSSSAQVWKLPPVLAYAVIIFIIKNVPVNVLYGFYLGAGLVRSFMGSLKVPVLLGLRLAPFFA